MSPRLFGLLLTLAACAQAGPNRPNPPPPVEPTNTSTVDEPDPWSPWDTFTERCADFEPPCLGGPLEPVLVFDPVEVDERLCDAAWDLSGLSTYVAGRNRCQDDQAYDIVRDGHFSGGSVQYYDATSGMLVSRESYQDYTAFCDQCSWEITYGRVVPTPWVVLVEYTCSTPP